MAGLINTGIWGFISSAKATGKKILNAAGEEVDEWVSTFVSGVSGWLIDKLGNAEFKSVFVREKFITNEFVYNRIRVTEDEEIVTSSIKIASYFDNGDGTFTVYPDLREADKNPLTDSDLLLGYYHNPGNSGVIYSVQQFTAISDPGSDQSILLEAEGDSIPYQHMIIARVGNIVDAERQSFIRISSRTNCQYFYDGIDSWAAYSDPEHVRCTLGHADIGLIPAWAREAVGSVKRWFGLIADGVIIRGTFILHNDKTIEDELNGREIQIRGDFEIREDGITGKWQEVIKYAKEASDSASSAAGSATTAGEHVTKIEELSSEFNVNYEKLSADFTHKVNTETTNALGAITSATEEATGTLQLTAKDFVLAFTNLVDTKTEEATDAISEAKKSAESSLTMTAEQLDLQFKKTVEEKTEEATGAITDKKESAESDIQASAEELTATFNKNAEEKVKEADGAITTSKNAAKSEVELTAKNLTATFEENVQQKTISAKGEIDATTESRKSELNLTAEGLITKFEEAVTDAEGDIIKEIGTQVTQNAKEWKVEIMGEDKDGNPNTILAAINADGSDIKIKGDKIEMDGDVIAKAIKATGLNISDKFVVKIDGNGNAKIKIEGEIIAESGVFYSALRAVPKLVKVEYATTNELNIESNINPMYSVYVVDNSDSPTKYDYNLVVDSSHDLVGQDINIQFYACCKNYAATPAFTLNIAPKSNSSTAPNILYNNKTIRRAVLKDFTSIILKAVPRVVTILDTGTDFGAIKNVLFWANGCDWRVINTSDFEYNEALNQISSKYYPK